VVEPALETEALTRRFGALAAVDEVSLRVERGAAHAVIGPNGAGKSTLLSLLSGELRASSGRVRIHGRDVTRAPPDAISRMGVGRSYQSANVFPPLTCADSVWLAVQSRARASMVFFRSAERDDAVGVRAARALDACGLAERRRVRAAQLSYGEQRQLELAMVLATDPSLLLLDEPLAGLGHDEAARVVALLRDIARDRTLVLVEHDMEAVFSLATVVTVMVSGRVLETGTPAAIRASPRVRDAYLGEDEP
jgi:branched-chain amino acid transport system ATP-binding protein